ncbi:hypothetical protein ABPG75_003825 [Micractinium tetrahymenae]
MAKHKGRQQQQSAAGTAADSASPGRSAVLRAGLVFGDGDRVLDKGVWKRWKLCQHCQQIVVERAKWNDCWAEIRFCSDRCKAEGKRNRWQQQHGQHGQQGQPLGQEQQPQQQESKQLQQEGRPEPAAAAAELAAGAAATAAGAGT